VPFLRVIRDKRGYETTYLMHWYRDGQRQRTRILYVFRSPGGVRVGRHVLEPEVMRQLEIEHPDIEFDWASVRENKQIIDSSPEPRRRRRPAEQEAPRAVRVAPPAEPAAPQQPPRPAIPSAIEGATPDEQIVFLSSWYPQVRGRIEQRASDPARREALLALAERLNPVAWTDADQITTGLQQAAEALERLSHVFAKRRRRARKRAADASGTNRTTEAADASPDEPPPAPPAEPTAADS
jgi:hypothetical protein